MESNKNRFNSSTDWLYSSYCILFSLEGIAAALLTFAIPGEKNVGVFLGISTQRWMIILVLIFFSLLTLILSLSIKSIVSFRNTLFKKLNKYNNIVFVITLIWLFIFLFPPIEVTLKYPAYLQRLQYLFLLILLVGFEVLILNISKKKKSIGWKALFLKPVNFLKSNYAIQICFLFPFIYMTPRLWVFDGHQYGVGNDFVPFSYFYKVYLIDFLSHFRIPLWSPSEAAGFPYLASPQIGALYPLNILSALYYWWKGSYGLLDHCWVTVFGISIFCVGLYTWLREFNWNKNAALLSALIISVSYQPTEIIRFTKAVESIAWLPWLLYFFTTIIRDPSKKRTFLFYFGFSFSVFSFITAGYLYYQYYSIFILAPFILFIGINQVRTTFGFSKLTIKLFDLIRPLVSFLAPFIVLIPYFLNVYLLLMQTYRRGTRDFFYSTEHKFSWIDHLGSLVYPPIASPEGWYYIGILPLALVLYYFFSRKSLRKHSGSIESDEWYFSPKIKIFMGFMIALVVSISFNRESPLFNFLWNYFPFFYGFRYWGRFTIMLLPLFAFVISASIDSLGIRLKSFVDNGKTNLQVNIWLKWSIISAMLISLSVYAHTFAPTPQWGISFYLVDSKIGWYSISLVIAVIFITLVLLAIRIGWFTQKVFRILPALFFSLVIIDLWPIGAFQWLIDIIPETNPPGRLNIAENIIPQSFNFSRTLAKTTISITPRFSVGPSPDWYYARYVNFYNDHLFEARFRDRLLAQGQGTQKLYFSKMIDHLTAKDFLQDSDKFSGSYEVKKYDGETLIVEIQSDQPGYFSFIDNWDPFWTVSVNGKPANLEILLGTFKSVKIPAGDSIIEFSYKPKLFPIDELKDLMQSSK